MHLSAGTRPAPDPENDILDVLAQERQVLEELTSLATQVRDALICCDATALEALAGRQETLAQRLVVLDGSRQALIEKWFAQDECESVSGKVQGKDEGTRLLAACEDVQKQVRALQTANGVNDQLLAGVARWMGGLVNGFAGLLDQAAPYDRHGSRPVQLESNLLVDHQV